MPLLLGTDGRKMSKSFNNTIDLVELPAEIYGKVMSMGDNVITEYLRSLPTCHFPISTRWSGRCRRPGEPARPEDAPGA